MLENWLLQKKHASMPMNEVIYHKAVFYFKFTLQSTFVSLLLLCTKEKPKFGSIFQRTV